MISMSALPSIVMQKLVLGAVQHRLQALKLFTLLREVKEAKRALFTEQGRQNIISFIV
jgi:hypothetical protein